MLCVADHFEPALNGADFETQRRRVEQWRRVLPQIASRHHGSDGVSYRHTFFYPADQYHPEHLNALADLKTLGCSDVEIHLHHDNDTEQGLAQTLNEFKDVLSQRHGLLALDPASGQVEFGFIHGDWALDNSAPDGRNCGVNNELSVLSRCGCYADFTLPSAPEPTQTRKINSIYYATDDPSRPKSHDDGMDSSVGAGPRGDLLLVQGPLALNWRSRKFGVLPRIDAGEISGDAPPAPARADLWIQTGIHVKGRPEWIFIKLHTHGCDERNTPVLLGQPMDDLLHYLETAYNDGIRYALHYVTAREMVSIIRAAEAGLAGDPHQHRSCRQIQHLVIPRIS
jgi:hypothetical protein